MTGDQWLQRLFETAQRQEQATDVSKITPEQLCGIGGTSMMLYNFDLSWFELLRNQDTTQAKQRFFRSGTLACWLANHCKKDALTTGHALLAVLLSDNVHLINRYAGSTDPYFEYMIPRSIAVFDRLAQLHLKEDTDGIKQYMEVAQNKIVPKHKYSMPILEFYRSLEAKDLSAMEINIKTMLEPKHHKYLNRDDRYADLFSFPGVKCAKLAWLKGFKVNIDNPLIPSNILPFVPLDVYENYSFPFQVD